MSEKIFERTAPTGYRELLPVWHKLASGLQKSYVILGVLATVASLVVVAFTAELSDMWIKILVMIPSLCLGLMTAFDLGNKANNARAAWRVLNAAVLSYENDETFTIQDLQKQYAAGEALLGEIKYNAPKALKH